MRAVSPLDSTEDLVRRVPNAEARTLIGEAWVCYSSGAYRAAAILAWMSVVEDILSKIQQLASGDDGQAAAVWEEVKKARGQADEGDRRKHLLAVERTLLGNAVDLEILDQPEADELAELQRDRNRAAHPSTLATGEVLNFRPERVHAQIRGALVHLLLWPALGGQGALEQFQEALQRNEVSSSPEEFWLLHFDRLRPRAQLNILNFAVRQALFEYEADPEVGPSGISLANRCADVVCAVATRRGPEATEVVRRNLDRAIEQDDARKLRILARFGRSSFFWEAMHPRAQSSFNAALARWRPEAEPRGYVLLDQVELIGLVRYPELVALLPELVQAFDRAEIIIRVCAMNTDLSFSWTPHLVRAIHQSKTYAEGESCGIAINNLRANLTPGELESILVAWRQNHSCLSSFNGIRNLAVMYGSPESASLRQSSAWLALRDAVTQLDDPVISTRYSFLME